ncbi:hypothetical protein ACLOJK_005060 [Asimina triloba]
MEVENNPPYLEITVYSAEGLQIGGRPIEKNAFATVRTTDSSGSCQATGVDRDGGSYPSWKEKLLVRLPPRDQSILVEVHCKTSRGAKAIGAVSIPMSEIQDDYVPPDQLHFLSYRLRKPDGVRNGIINLSIKMVGSKEVKHPARTMSVVGPEFLNRPSPEGAQQQQAVMASRCSDGIAIGIPVSTLSSPCDWRSPDPHLRIW